MEQFKSLNWKMVLKTGLLAGGILLYAGVIKMIAAFHEREVIDDFITLGRLVLLITPFLAAFYTAHKLKRDGENIAFVMGSGIIIGILTAIPTIILLLFNDINDVSNIFVNVNRDWIDVVTFDNRKELLTGIFMLALASIVSGLVGSVFYVLPDKPRRALIYGLSMTLIVSVFGETVRLVLKENMPKDALNELFRRDTLKQQPAIILFVVSTTIGYLWAMFGQQAKGRYQAMEDKQRSTSQMIGRVIFMGILLILPWVIGRTLSDVAVTIGLFVLMGLGLNIAIGLAGLLDLGYVTNYAVGAYILAVFTSIGPLGLGNGVFTFWMVIPIALLSAMFAGFIFAVPVLRMRGDYLAIATLGFGEIIGKLAISDWLAPVIGGAQGVQAIPKPIFLGIEVKNPEELYYIILAACLVTLFVSIRLNNSRTGRQWMAIREDEDVATAMGIDTARAKLLAFTLSAATGGVAGAIFAAKVGTVFPTSFVVLISINVLSLIIVGGIGSNLGIVVGAVVLIGMPELLREFSDFRFLLYGILLIAMMINRPEGLIPSQVTSRESGGLEKSKVGAGD
jgi:branched-chain amino acid transport system permease protein